MQSVICCLVCIGFFVQAEDGIRDLVRSRGLGDVYKRQRETFEHFGKRLIRYGVAADADLRMEGEKGEYRVFHDKNLLGVFRLNVPGRHLSLIHI
mgnify:CR=1 FL=1